jgi:Glycosyltransferase family 10 (fucosyltransferase) C-term/Fucosyltransferase, N-terminal
MTTILFFNDTWRMAPRALAEAAAPHRLSFDPARLFEADAVVFHIPTLAEPPALPKRPGQRWVAWSMESEVNYPQLRDASFMGRFDLTMTYRQDADIWTPYLGPELLRDLATPPQPKTERATAVFIASNPRDRSGRSDYVRELMKHLPVDSYGQCLNNRTLTGDLGRASKLATIARYKFTLAFENSIAPDYVTEKFFDPLVAGSVPVYLGARNVADYAPGECCYLDTTDFADPRSLAERLRFLATDASGYARYLEWKTTDLRDGFRALVERSRDHPVSRLAALLATGR